MRVLSSAKNSLLTQVGRGTAMGALLRRYWHPVAAVSELARTSTKQVRLLGESLILDRHEDGRYILRGANPEGRAASRGGLVWAYLGPDPAPLIPNYEAFGWPNGFVQIVLAEVPCNWLQGQENSVDPVHFEWLHAKWSARQSGWDPGRTPAHVGLEFEEFEYGITSGRRTHGPGRHPQSTGIVCLWPHALYTGNHFEWRIPMDDVTTLSITWWFSPVPQDVRPFVQEDIPYWYGPVADSSTGRWITTHTLNQDFAAWLGQGTVTDRSVEHLGRSDAGIIMLRRRFLADLENVARGADPKAIIRDEARNSPLVLPIDPALRAELLGGWTRAGLNERLDLMRRRFPGADCDYYGFQVGQPRHVRIAYERAMGITGVC